MSRRAPRWLTWVLAGGLALVFVGERMLAGIPAARLVFSIAGAALVVGSLVWRILSWRQARAQGAPEEAAVEARLAVAYAGCVLALVLYFFSTEAGAGLLGIDVADQARHGRYRTILQVLWTIVLAISLVPALAAQLGMGTRRGTPADGAQVLEAARVDETSTAGLVVALAAVLLFLVGFIATGHDKAADLGYFRTASPGTATRAVARSLRSPLQVLLFFPRVNPVAREVTDYFQALDRAGGRARVELHDRLADPVLARNYDIREDGTIVLKSGDKVEHMTIPVDLDMARPQLRTFDRDMQARLMELARGPRVAYLTTGHGEMNDSATARFSIIPAGMGGVQALRQLLRLLNYDVRDLGLAQGLGQDVPKDASVVILLGPGRAFLPEEMAALDRYMARGGSLLLALQPRSAFRLGPLEQRLGLRFDGLPLADDKQYVRRRGDLSDRGMIVAGEFSAHAAVTTAALAGDGAAALFPDAGYLEIADSTRARPRFLVRTAPTTFVDRNSNFELEDPPEKRGEYNIGAAVESSDSARALVYADAEMFTDAVLGSLRINASLAADGLRWLGREESFAGTTQSEEDVPIQHTRTQDVAWFYSTILGAPALVLAFGLFGVRRRRRGRQP